MGYNMFMKLIMFLLLASSCYAKDIVVMEIDTGTDALHFSIMNHINKDDVSKYPSNYVDNQGHGSHIAGLIVKDTCPQVKLISCKFFDTNKGDGLEEESCLNRAINEHVDFVNLSWGGDDYNQRESDLLNKLNDNGTKIIVAAGNEHKYLGSPCFGYFPACLLLSNMTVVGNLSKDGKMARTSNYGVPGMEWEVGEDVYSTLPSNQWGYMTGTSQSAAIHTNRLLKQKCKEIIK